MNKKITATFILLLMAVFTFAQNTIYSYKVKDIDGNEFDFASLKGKKIMIVNTASKCGFSPQYEELQQLYKKYKDQGFVIVGFPANNFKEQEPGTDKEIAQFCTLEYGVTFPMMSKVSVKGDDMAPIYKFLTQKKLNGEEDSSVKWNFQKYLIDENGHLYDYYSPWRSPDAKGIVNWIKS
jgi:glutathione peroxidase